MPSNRDLVAELTDVVASRKSGRLYVYTKQAGNTSATKLSVFQGELRNINTNKLSWRDSLDLILNGTILKILFVSNRSDSANFDKTVTIDILELIQILSGHSVDTSWHEPNLLTDRAAAEFLVHGATEIVTELIGDSGSDYISDITHKYPPDSNPRQFLDACRDLVAQVVGDRSADKAFEKLYRYGLK